MTAMPSAAPAVIDVMDINRIMKMIRTGIRCCWSTA